MWSSGSDILCSGTQTHSSGAWGYSHLHVQLWWCCSSWKPWAHSCMHWGCTGWSSRTSSTQGMATCLILCQSRLLCMGVDMADHVKHWANGEVERNAFQEFFLLAVSMCCVCPSSKHGLWCSRILENHLAKSLSSWLCESAITELSKHFLCRETDRQTDR